MKGSEDSAISEGPEGDPPAPTANDGAEVKDASGARIGWGTLIKVSAALSAVGGLCLHLVGASTNAHYYRHWGLDPAMFTLATDMTFVQGYETLVNSYAEAIVKVWRDYWLVMLGYGVLCSGTLLVMVGWFIHRQAIVDKVYVEERTRWWLRLGFASILAFALPTVAVPFGALTLLLVLASPLTAAKLHAEHAGGTNAPSLRARLRKGDRGQGREVHAPGERRRGTGAWLRGRELSIAHRPVRPLGPPGRACRTRGDQCYWCAQTGAGAERHGQIASSLGGVAARETRRFCRGPRRGAKCKSPFDRWGKIRPQHQKSCCFDPRTMHQPCPILRCREPLRHVCMA